MNQKKILILYTSIGLGHKYIANNIAYHLIQAGFEVQQADILKVQSGWTVKLGSLLHGWINRYTPSLWSWMYRSNAVTALVKGFRYRVARSNSRATETLLSEYQPDMVISTQAAASGVMAYLKQTGRFHGKFLIAFSDYHFHPLWTYPEADFYLANTDEQKQEMTKLGIDDDLIEVCGITLSPIPKVDSNEVKHRIGVSQEKVVLVVSGSLGIGLAATQILQTYHALENLQPPVTMLVVCGKNERLYQTLLEHQSPRFKVFGYYEPLTELYQVADVILSKPGGMSIAEMLALGKRPVVTHWLPGQEELNYLYLLKHQFIYPKPVKNSGYFIARSVAHLLQSEDRIEREILPEIIRKGLAGQVLISAINKVFHGV